jgi:hypothetical protein
MPGVARVLGKTGIAVGLGLVLIGPSVQSADAILPAPGKTAVGHETGSRGTPAKASAKVKASVKAKSGARGRAKSKARHKPRSAAARQAQSAADLRPGTYPPPIVTHRATNHRATNHRATNHPATNHPATNHPATNHPATNHPATNHPATNHPATNHPAAPKPKSPAKTHPAMTHPARTSPGKHPKPPATTRKPPTRSRMNPVVHRHHRRRPSLAGTWSLFGGEFKFSRIAVRTISDTVISQRIGVFCSAVNDQDGQLVVRQLDKRDYIGTWQWFNPKTCESAGYGTVKIMVWRDKLTATFTAYPPAGTPGPPDTTMMERLP